MVDAITSYNANKPTNPKKDLTINWNKLTVKEIKEYEGEGQEVPEYIKKWADYIEHLESVPDDITYATYFNEDANSAKYNQSSALRNNDTTSLLNKGINPSSATQGEVYQQLCKDTVTSIKSVTDQLEEIMKSAEKEVGEAEKSKDGICDRIQTLQQRIQTLKDDKKDPLAPMEIIEINQQIKAAGESGVTTMDMRLISLQNIGADVTDAYDLVSGASSLASTAASMSSSIGKFSTITLKYSKELQELSKEKKRDLKSAVEQQEGNVTTVEGYKSSVASTANQFIPPGTESDTSNSGSINSSSNSESSSSISAKNDEKTAANKTKQTQTAKKTKEEKSKTLADEKILTDPNEILKRKQKRGEA